MPGLLGRELNADEQTIETALRATMEEHRTSRTVDTSFFETAAAVPELLCPAAITVLEQEPDAAQRRWLYTQLMDKPECLRELVRPGHFAREQLRAVCLLLMQIDAFFDVRLATLLPRPHTDGSQIDGTQLVRILDTLDEISPGSRLILPLNHLTHHPDPRVASKASRLVARRLRNDLWVTRQLASNDPRVRANVIEGLWGIPSAAVRDVLRAGLEDDSNRVVGNALFGLHLLKEPGVAALIRQMLEDPRPAFRRTAAWLMGQTGDAEFAAFLQHALADRDLNVRRSAERALAVIQEAASTNPAPADPTGAGPSAAAAGTEAAPASEPPVTPVPPSP